MFQSKDKVLTIHTGEEPTQVVFSPADFGFVNVPEGSEDTKQLFKNLYNTTAARSIIMAFTRHKRHNRLAALSNLYVIESWEYFDTITLQYEKTLGSNNGRFVPISEQAHLFYKGDQPDASKTSWFSDSRTNATNLWDVQARPEDGNEFTYSGRFSWEMGLLIYSMAKPLAHRTLIYTLDTDHENAIAFARHLELKIHCVVKDSETATALLKGYQEKYG